MIGVDHIQGHTYHGRRGEVSNGFRYSIDYVLMDPETVLPLPALFSRNRFNLASLHDRDHGGPPKNGEGAAWARQVLKDHVLPGAERILLLAQPRIFGHVFNPVSFWLCYDYAQNLRVVIAEVSNTFGDRHCYLCYNRDLSPIGPDDKVEAKKVFHVSPFQPIEGDYTFRFSITPKNIGIWIEYVRPNGGLIATLTGPRKPISNRSLLWAVVRRPFGSRRVQALIHWQALKLWWKGATFRSRPEPPETQISR